MLRLTSFNALQHCGWIVETMENHQQQNKTMLNTYKDTNSVFALKKTNRIPVRHPIHIPVTAE